MCHMHHTQYIYEAAASGQCSEMVCFAFCSCFATKLAYAPPAARSDSWLPCSTTCPPLATQEGKIG